MTDLRLLGLAMRGQRASEVIGQLRLWKRIGFGMMVATGSLLAGAKAETYYGNPFFQLKLGLIALVGVHAMFFRRRVYGKTAKLDEAPSMPGAAKLAAALSLALWLGIVSAGRLIAYYEPARKDSVRQVPRRPDHRLQQRGRCGFSGPDAVGWNRADGAGAGRYAAAVSAACEATGGDAAGVRAAGLRGDAPAAARGAAVKPGSSFFAILFIDSSESACTLKRVGNLSRQLKRLAGIYGYEDPSAYSSHDAGRSRPVWADCHSARSDHR